VSESVPSGCRLQAAHECARGPDERAPERLPLCSSDLAIRWGDVPTGRSRRVVGYEAAARGRESSGSTGHLFALCRTHVKFDSDGYVFVLRPVLSLDNVPMSQANDILKQNLLIWQGLLAFTGKIASKVKGTVKYCARPWKSAFVLLYTVP
jgi:hypothetical protein